MADAATAPIETRSGRFWLYAPIALLLLVAAAWSAAWFVIRERAREGLDVWSAAEARAGRSWTCKDRGIGGYPFRIEVSCASLSFVRDGVTVSLGRVESVAQVYQPRFVITEIDGPLTASDGTVTVRGDWRLLETSVRAGRDGLQRASLVIDGARFTLAGAAPDEVALSADRFEVHLRPNLSRPQDQALDAALLARGTRTAAADAFLGGTEPLDVQIDATATRVHGLAGGPVPQELERWREAGGQLDLLAFSLIKGARRIEAKGELRLDAMHRPAGEVALSAAGIEGLVAALTGNRAGGSLLGSLFAKQSPQSGAPALTPLPPIRLDNGRVALGPFVLPGVRLLPVY